MTIKDIDLEEHSEITGFMEELKKIGEKIAESAVTEKPTWIGHSSKYKNLINTLALFQTFESAERVEVLMNISPEKTFREIAEKIGKSIGAVQNHIKKLLDTGLIEAVEGGKYKISEFGLLMLGVLKIVDNIYNKVVVQHVMLEKKKKIEEAIKSLEKVAAIGGESPEIERYKRKLKKQLKKLEQELEEKLGSPNRRKCEETLAKMFGVNILSNYRSVYRIGGEPLEVKAKIFIKPEYIGRIREIIEETCGELGILEILSVENAVPEGFKIDPKHKGYDSPTNTLKWDGTWCTPPDPVFNLEARSEEELSREISYTIHPNKLVRGVLFNPVLIIGLVREGKPIVKIRINLVNKPIWLTVISKKRE